MTKQQKYHANHPWVKFVCWARRRCSGKDSDWKPYYYDKGIECKINSEDLRVIWFRDKAYLQLRPSLDRIDSNKNYEPDNIRFIEFKDNVKLAKNNRRLKNK